MERRSAARLDPQLQSRDRVLAGRGRARDDSVPGGAGAAALATLLRYGSSSHPSRGSVDIVAVFLSSCFETTDTFIACWLLLMFFLTPHSRTRTATQERKVLLC